MVPNDRFRWDWLCPVTPVPYVPTLGPVRPAALSAELFDAVVGNAGTDRFLPYDKDRRWSSTKDERVIVEEVIHQPGLTVIPTLSTRGHSLVKIHHYGTGTPTRSEMTEWSSACFTTIGASASHVIWCQDVPHGASTRVMCKTFGAGKKYDRGPLTPLAECRVADTFPAFADQLTEQGFAFLHQRMRAGFSDGPILVAVDDGRIVGAVGPLGILLDPSGAHILPPAYFAVHPDYRRRGHGTALWRAAMAWGAEHGAEYKILQAASGSPSERLYLSEGLATLGFVCRQNFTAPAGP
ncbi:MAG: GNAT family N-acetyltransferase [Pseudonocardiaceae bacterium]